MATTKTNENAAAAAPKAKISLKKSTDKKPATKTTKAVVPDVRTKIQVGGNEYDLDAVRAKVLAAVAESGPVKKDSVLDVYVKPEDGKAYYAIDGVAAGDVDL